MDSDSDREEQSQETMTHSYEVSVSSEDEQEVLQPAMEQEKLSDSDEKDPTEDEESDQGDPDEAGSEEGDSEEDPEEATDGEDGSSSEEDLDEDEERGAEEGDSEPEPEGAAAEPEQGGGEDPQLEEEAPIDPAILSDDAMPALEDMLREPTPPREPYRAIRIGRNTWRTPRKRVRFMPGRQFAPRDISNHQFELGESSRAAERYSPYPSRVPLPRPPSYPRGFIPPSVRPQMPPHPFRPEHYPPPPSVNPWDVMRPGGPNDHAAREMHQASDIEAMMRRIDQLERENARLRWDADRMARELQDRRNHDGDSRG